MMSSSRTALSRKAASSTTTLMASVLTWVCSELDGNYYYAKADGALIVNQTCHCRRMGDSRPPGGYIYSFDADGKLKNGIVAENDSLYYYKDGVRYYAGLIEIDGSYYYVRTSGEVVHGCSHWITKTNGLMSERSYTFDDNGRMTDPEIQNPAKDGIVAEDGSLYYYRDGVRYYAGLIEIDGSYYYVDERRGGSRSQLLDHQDQWSDGERSYQFAEDGKMINPEIKNLSKNGIVAEDGSLYYYRDGVRYYAGLIEIDGSYYYVDERRGGSRSQLLDHQDQWSDGGAELSVCRGRQDD